MSEYDNLRQFWDQSRQVALEIWTMTGTVFILESTESDFSGQWKLIVRECFMSLVEQILIHRCAHIVGKSGRGTTTFLLWLAMYLLKAHNGSEPHAVLYLTSYGSYLISHDNILVLDANQIPHNPIYTIADQVSVTNAQCGSQITVTSSSQENIPQFDNLDAVVLGLPPPQLMEVAAIVGDDVDSGDLQFMFEVLGGNLQQYHASVSIISDFPHNGVIRRAMDLVFGQPVDHSAEERTQARWQWALAVMQNGIQDTWNGNCNDALFTEYRCDATTCEIVLENFSSKLVEAVASIMHGADGPDLQNPFEGLLGDWGFRGTEKYVLHCDLVAEASVSRLARRISGPYHDTDLSAGGCCWRSMELGRRNAHFIHGWDDLVAAARAFAASKPVNKLDYLYLFIKSPDFPLVDAVILPKILLRMTERTAYGNPQEDLKAIAAALGQPVSELHVIHFVSEGTVNAVLNFRPTVDLQDCRVSVTTYQESADLTELIASASIW